MSFDPVEFQCKLDEFRETLSHQDDWGAGPDEEEAGETAKHFSYTAMAELATGEGAETEAWVCYACHSCLNGLHLDFALSGSF